MSLPPSPQTPTGDDSDPSMDDILASIRRILDDDQAAKEPSGNVLMLDTSMMIEPGAGSAHPAGDTHATPAGDGRAAPMPAATQAEGAPQFAVAPDEGRNMEPLNDDLMPLTDIPRDPVSPSVSALVAPAAAAAAANSVGALMRTLAAERGAAVSRAGNTIEDIVREEVRPFLKDWLDAHLPPIVERLVQAEIERVVARQAG